MSKFPTGTPQLDVAIVSLIRGAIADGAPLNSASIVLAGRTQFGPTFPDDLTQAEVDDAITFMAHENATFESDTGGPRSKRKPRPR